MSECRDLVFQTMYLQYAQNVALRILHNQRADLFFIHQGFSLGKSDLRLDGQGVAVT